MRYPPFIQKEDVKGNEKNLFNNRTDSCFKVDFYFMWSELTESQSSLAA